MTLSETEGSRLIGISRKWNSTPSLCNLAYNRNENTNGIGQASQGDLCSARDKYKPGGKRLRTRETIKKVLSFWRMRSNSDMEINLENENGFLNREHTPITYSGTESVLDSLISRDENGNTSKDFSCSGKDDKQYPVDLPRCGKCSATKSSGKTIEKIELKKRTQSMQMLNSAEYRKTQKPFNNIIKSFKSEEIPLNDGSPRLKRNFNKSQLVFDKSECSSSYECKNIEDELSLDFLIQFKSRLKLLRNSKSLNKTVPSNVFSKVINYYFANKSST